MYFYIKTESNLWTVGYEDQQGTWHTDSDQDSKEEAAERVHWLNGGSKKNELLEQIKKEYAVTVFEKKELPAQPEFADTDEQIIQVEKIVNSSLESEPDDIESTLKKYKSELVESLKKMLFGKTTPTIPILQVHAIANFTLANHNFNQWDQIKGAFEGEDEMTLKHLEDKFRFDSRKSLIAFMPSLSEDYQGQLILYIMKNYKGVKPESIERYYIK